MPCTTKKADYYYEYLFHHSEPSHLKLSFMFMDDIKVNEFMLQEGSSPLLFFFIFHCRQDSLIANLHENNMKQSRCWMLIIMKNTRKLKDFRLMGDE